MIKRWSKKVNETSHAMNLEQGVFKLKSAKAIAQSISKSAKESHNLKSSPFKSAMSMLNFYINRAGKNLADSRKKIIEHAKNELRKIYGKPIKKEEFMPEKKTIKKAQKAKKEGKAPSTQAGSFVKEEMDHIRKGSHGAKNAKQAIAIGLSKARRSGVDIPAAPGKKKTRSESTHPGRITRAKVSPKRSKAASERLKGESHAAASHKALSTHARRVAKKRST